MILRIASITTALLKSMIVRCVTFNLSYTTIAITGSKFLRIIVQAIAVKVICIEIVIG